MSFPDRIFRALRALVREMLSPDVSDDVPAWAYFVPWELQVDTVTNTAFTGRPTSSRCPLPNPITIPLMPGIAGTLIKPAQGSLVAVAFLNGDPTRPRVVSWDQTVPVNVGLAGGTLGVVRVEDLGDAGTFVAGVAPVTLVYTAPNGSVWNITLTANGNPVSAVIAPITNPADVGKIITKATNGSTIVKAG